MMGFRIIRCIMTKEITRYAASGGVKIYCIPKESFPSHYTDVYLVLTGKLVVFIDLGPGRGDSNARLEKGSKRSSSGSARRLR